MSPFQSCKEHSDLILESALRSVSPENLIKEKIALNGGILSISDSRFDLSPISRFHLLGMGKGAAGLCREFESIAGDWISGGVVISGETYMPKNPNIISLKGDHPVPGSNSCRAGEELIRYVQNIRKDDLVIACITGGASAMAVSLPPGLTLPGIRRVNNLLVRCGAGIGEINTVRKHLSAIKGGLLAAQMDPAAVISLLLSDVTGSDPGTIGSGPFHGDNTTFTDALNILGKYNIRSKCGPSVIGYLERGVRGLVKDTPGLEHQIFKNHHTFVLGNNRNALEGAAAKAEELGYSTRILPGELAGDVKAAAGQTAEMIRKNAGMKGPGKVLILFGGECTVSVTGKGMGGRVQQFLLLLLQELKNDGFSFFIAGAGTDGKDGNSGDAGAWIDHRTTEKLGDDPGRRIQKYLRDNDSNTLFRKLNQHIHTGATGTNVMDIFMAFI